MQRTPAKSNRRLPERESPSSPHSSPAVPDAVQTFIKWPERKRRSLDNMDRYKKGMAGLQEKSVGQLLQELMKAMEEIPEKVLTYPLMRKDIKVFLEQKADNSMQMLFELGRRVEGMVAPTEETRRKFNPGQDEVMKRLETLETKVSERIQDLENAFTYGGVANEQINLTPVTDRLGVMETYLEERLSEAKSEITGKIDQLGNKIIDKLEEAPQITSEEALNNKMTYANIVKGTPLQQQPALHSVIISSENPVDTGEEVLQKIRARIDAKGEGLKVDKVRKAKDQKVIIGCTMERELEKLEERLKKGQGLVITRVQNKNPLILVKDVLNQLTDEELLEAVKNQNKKLLENLDDSEQEIKIKYKKRTRNPQCSHIVLQVNPKMWRRMTEAGYLHIDLQRVRVEDQSPLIQCTRCLTYGHGRKFCKESADRCSHCGGLHLQAECPDKLAGVPPQCCNCSHSERQNSNHNAFSQTCPTRRKWDFLARSTTAYQ